MAIRPCRRPHRRREKNWNSTETPNAMNRGGAPRGNRNALKTGCHTVEMRAVAAR
jgi:hypothetical protein